MTLLERYDALLLDLDGTVYRGGSAVDGAEPAIRAAHQAGVGVRFVTNNASRTPEDVAEHLNRLGVPAKHDEVTTSAQAGAGVLVGRVPAGSDVLVLGTDALAREVTNRGFRPVRAAGDGVTAVLQGLSQQVGWAELAEACLAIRAGALWVACNADRTLPTERGLLPGNGALVEAVRVATDAEPLVAGKPQRPLMDDAIRAQGARHPLAVGDRLDTDIAGANNVGIDSLLVLTGVSTAADLLAAPANLRPTYVAADLHGIERDDVRIEARDGWQVDVTDTELSLRHNGSDTDPLGALRALCAAWWAAHDGAVGVRPLDDAAAKAVAALRLPAAGSGIG
ncbi:MAG TPA: HAD-IIA family hydrolase [Pseudonocardiaceae bacterium]|jgi:HAD superfamily hydrolase (TIGR01450 family)|nr:HAD-IIA family hydrolase [Pseudonocardiaceae bacterium]